MTIELAGLGEVLANANKKATTAVDVKDLQEE